MTETTGPLPGKPPPPPSPRVSAPVIRKASTAWQARVTGLSWEQAADAAGYGSSEAAMKAVRNTYGHVPRIERADARHLWRERVEVLWRLALRDVVDQRPGAVTAAVRVAQAATTLDGLNEPTRVDLDVNVTQTLEAIERELLSHDL